jgi:hypothetical protein
MSLQTAITQEARWPSDPAVIETGVGSLTGVDRMARYLGWFSLALGLTQLASARTIARGLGVEGKEPLIWASGARGIASGITCLSTEKSCGIWSRIAGDVLDITVLAPAYRDDNPKKPNVAIALSALMGVTLLDLSCGQGLASRHRRGGGPLPDYRRRSGFPGGAAAARGAAVNFSVPDDMRAEPRLPAAATPRIIH